MAERGTFRRIASELAREIEGGRLRPGAALPSERDLTERFGVARGTIRSALRELEQLGAVEVAHGQGWRVAPNPGTASVPATAYEHVAHVLRERIQEGTYGGDAPLPSEADLVAEFDVSRATVRRAYAELQREGLVKSRRGSGVFLARDDFTEPEDEGRWVQHGERPIYDSQWIRVGMADISVPSGERFEHHVVWMPPAAMAVVLDDDETNVLLSWRHRFAPDVWNWELPGGLLDDNEKPEDTISREIREETGYQVRSIEHLVTFEPMIGMVRNPHYVYLARGAELIGSPTEFDEGRFQWVPVSRLRRYVREGKLANSGALVGVLHYLAFG